MRELPVSGMKGILGGRRLLLAPMAGVTDPVFRSICRELGADLCFTEMISAKGLMYANEKTRRLLDTAPSESDVSVQIFGHEPETMASQAAWIEEALGPKLVSIDINMGCPVRKIVTKGDGSALMKEPALASAIVSAVKRAVSVPVTCKFRRSWDPSDQYEEAWEFGLRMEEAGADAVCIHGRYSTQMYRGWSDRGCIAEAKRRMSVPVVGNGDVFTGEDAVLLADETGCDAVMIARGAMGNPWIFADACDALADGGGFVPPSWKDRISMCRRHIREFDEFANGHLGDMKRHAMKYVQGMPGASKARGAFGSCRTAEDFESVLNDLEKACQSAEESCWEAMNAG